MKFLSNVSGAKFDAEFEIVGGPHNFRLSAEICEYIRKTYNPTPNQLNYITAILNDGLSGCNGFVAHRHPNGKIKNVCLNVTYLNDPDLFFEMLNILSEFEIGIRINKDDVTNDTVDLFYRNNWWLEKRSFLEQLKSLKPFRWYATATRFSESDMPSEINPIELD